MYKEFNDENPLNECWGPNVRLASSQVVSPLNFKNSPYVELLRGESPHFEKLNLSPEVVIIW